MTIQHSLIDSLIDKIESTINNIANQSDQKERDFEIQKSIYEWLEDNDISVID